MWKSVGVWAGLKESHLLILRSEACFLGGFVEDMSDRIMSRCGQLLLEVAETGVWGTGGGAQKSEAFVVSNLPSRWA